MTSSARRSGRWRRRWRTSRPCINSMIVEGGDDDGRADAPGRLADRTCRRRRSRCARRRRGSASTVTPMLAGSATTPAASPAAQGRSGGVSVHFEIADRVARVTIDRPEVLNAVDVATEAELQRSGARSKRDDEVRCVVLTGAGEKAFCAGADMKGGRATAAGLDYWATPRPNGFGGIAYRRSLDVPVVARVNGYALGGGFEMVLGCDIVIAAETRPVRPARAARRPHAARRRHGAVAPPDPAQAGDGHHADRPAPAAPTRRCASAWSTRSCRRPSSTPRSTAGWTRSWPARRCRCARSSRRCNRTGHLSPAEAQALRTPALVEALQSEDALEGVQAFDAETGARLAGTMSKWIIASGMSEGLSCTLVS